MSAAAVAETTMATDHLRIARAAMVKYVPCCLGWATPNQGIDGARSYLPGGTGTAGEWEWIVFKDRRSSPLLEQVLGPLVGHHSSRATTRAAIAHQHPPWTGRTIAPRVLPARVSPSDVRRPVLFHFFARARSCRGPDDQLPTRPVS